ncbi:MAG: Rab family GTPase [Bacteroidia bacterium]
MASQNWFSKKVVILGAPSVGKSSLIGRFVYQKFSDSYLSTIGVKIDKKTITQGDYTVDMILWEVAGQEKLIQSYLKGCEAVIYVIDLSRPETFENLAAVCHNFTALLEDLPFFCVGNKLDLVTEQEALSIQKEYAIAYLASAKTGDTVETLFSDVAKALIDKYVNKP